MAEKTGKMIRIRWGRSGIGFTRHQKMIVRSLGLMKLNHSVLRPDTPQIRGIVASVPHLLEIVTERSAPAWENIPEYAVHAPVAAAPAESAAAANPEAMSEPAAGQAASPVVEAAEAGQITEGSPEEANPAQSGAE